MRPHLPLLSSILLTTALAKNNDTTFSIRPAPTNAIVDVTVTQTIEIADYPTTATGLIYDTSPIKPPNAATPMAMPTSVFITAPSNSTKPTVAKTSAGTLVASKTGAATPSATTKSLGIALDVRISQMWQGLLAVAVVAVVWW
ncbi:hypothetical protein FKW77_004790 [Venturia effusa]|uniref:Uncharacterized protein n=1 Tax=Venturia effusa TaxID=50376 RepID=A0A517L594_9PEZI|nr:hypothetical protein FKW77_004790 [Venturia effusa]